MKPLYAYSFDGERYIGSHDTRRRAFQAAMERSDRLPERPLNVYVGRIVPADPKATGNARHLIRHMAWRFREDWADADEHYLADVSDEQAAELDAALAMVILGWLQKHELMPRTFDVEAISEHPVPPPPAVPPAPDDEVHDLGETMQPPDGL